MLIHSYKDSASTYCGSSICQALDQVSDTVMAIGLVYTVNKNPLTSKHGKSATVHVAKFSSLPRGSRAREEGAVCAYLEVKIA